jgi:hypothetical protein
VLVQQIERHALDDLRRHGWLSAWRTISLVVDR